jgi:hypothetical protein
MKYGAIRGIKGSKYLLTLTSLGCYNDENYDVDKALHVAIICRKVMQKWRK